MRIIVHLDADAFFASVEQAADCRLRGKPLAVGGEKRGIIASASYEARRFGVYTPMPTVRARKLCPKLIILPGDFDKYEHFSRWMFSYAQDFTPDVEIASIDEGYFDLSAVRKPPVGVAEIIRTAIRQSLKISVSEGIASNKLVSQIASKLRKPAAFEHVPAGGEIRFLHPLPNRWLPGVGPQMAQRLNAAGLASIRHVAGTPVEMLQLLAGKMAFLLRSYANGIDDRPVVAMSAPAKSYSHQQTFEADITDEEYAEAVLRRMADELMAKVRAENKSIRTLTVKVRYNDMAEDQCGESLLEPTDLETDLYGRIHLLFRQAWKRRVSLRLVSLKLSNVYDGFCRLELPLQRSAQEHETRRRLADSVDALRKERGHRVLLRGHDFRLRERPVDSSRVGVAPPAGDSSMERNSPQSQRDSIIQPRVARNELPWVVSRQAFNPKGVASARCKSESLHIDKRTPENRRSTTRSFVPLAIHSCYSFLNSTLSIEAIVQLAKQYELPAIALTDEGNLHGAVAFTQAARAAGIKPILGAEVLVEGGLLRLYVENVKGYANLCRLLSLECGMRNAECGVSPHPGGEGGPLTGLNSIRLQGSANPSRNVRPSNSIKRGNPLSLSPGERAGVRGKDPSNSRSSPLASAAANSKAIKVDQLEGLTEGLLAIGDDALLAPLFPGRFYTHHASHIAHHVPRIALFPIHYAQPGDRWKFDVVQSIRTRTLLRQAHPEKVLTGEFHFRPPAEMAALFRDCPELLANTLELAERCEFELPLGAPQFPAFSTPDGSTPHSFLRKLVLEGLRRRYRERAASLQPQVEVELNIIGEVGYEEYFLVVWDILQDCRQHGIDWITRGSAADSLVCYCLGISDVCPIRFDLDFRRFLNKDRMKLNKLPDIDVDFPHDRKDDVVDLIFQKYGPEHTAVVGGFSTFQARSAVADVAKVLGVSEYQIRRFTEHFPWTSASDISSVISHSQECRDLPLTEEPYRSALQMAAILDGFPRYPKMHPCGVVLSRQPMWELTPAFISNKGYPTTHFDMDAVEAVGLIKIDILAQGGLAVMRDVKEMLATSSSVKSGGNGDQSHSAAPAATMDLSLLEPWEDPEVWKMIASGSARAVHHIESPAMVGLSRQCQVRDIDGLVAIVSVIRPGAANEQKKVKFARRYQGLEPVTYPHPSLERCLESTFGLVVYEEHILQICEAFAGLLPGRADVLRRALGKQKQAVIEEIRHEFMGCARARGHSYEKILEVWELVSGFAGYAFCKAHSTAYGVEAYQSAWLKRYYPAQFMAAVLSNGKGFYHPLVYVLECHRLGIPLLPPFVNQPGPMFTVEEALPPPSSTEHFPSFAGADVTPASQDKDSSNLEPPDTSNPAKWSSLSPRERDGVRGNNAPELASPSDQRTKLPGFSPPHVGAYNAQARSKLAIRVPLIRIKGLTERTKTRLLEEHEHQEFASLSDFYRRVAPTPEEMESMIRVGAFDPFGKTRTAQFWEAQHLYCAFGAEAGAKREQRKEKKESEKTNALPGPATSLPHLSIIHHPTQGWLLPPPTLDRLPPVPLEEPTRRQCLEWETELLDFAVSAHPLELHRHIAWDTYCPVSKLGEHIGEQIVTCGLIIEQRTHHQITGEPMKFLTLADWTGMVETELFAPTYRSYGLATVRYPVLEVTATVEPFENGNGFSLRVHRAGKPRIRGA